MADKYHHGNLKQELIRNGFNIINTDGIEGLSFRKVAALCGVSHTAAYAHFANKDELLEAIKEKVSDEFAEELEQAVELVDETDAESRIIAMGKRYVSFLIENPDYYKFLFENQQITIHIDIDYYYSDDFKAFNLLKRLYVEMLEENAEEKDKEEQEAELIRLWSTIHGIASTACMKDVEYEGSFEKIVNNLFG